MSYSAIDALLAPLSSTLSLTLEQAFSHTCKGVCPHSSCLLAVVRSFRQGLVYGTKVRFPHALVMTFMFGRQATVREKLIAVLTATYTHARSLAIFASFYKACTCLLRHLRGKEDVWNSLLAGAMGGSLVFGDNSSVNSQINLYVLSRVVFASFRLLAQKKLIPDWENNRGYSIFAGLIWAAVMVLFEKHIDTLQPSLASSMTYLYKDSDKQPNGIVPATFVEWVVAPVD